MEMEVWISRRRRGAAVAEALQEALARVGVPEGLWKLVTPKISRSGYPYIAIHTLSLSAAQEITRALEAVPQQHTVSGAGDEPEHTRADS